MAMARMCEPLIDMNEKVFNDNILETNMRVLEYSGAFTRETFWKSNPQAFHAVMYFLFEKLDPIKAKQKFRDCWPLCDKKDEAAFRRVCSTWIENIVKEDKSAQFPSCVGPLLVAPHGPKFVRFMVKFTSYIMHTDLMRMGGSLEGTKLFCPTVKTPKNVESFNMTKSMLITAARSNTSTYVKSQERRLNDFLKFKSCMNDQISRYRKLNKDLDAANKLKEQLTQRLRNQPSGHWSHQSRGEAIERIMAYWNLLETIAKTDDAAWEVLSSLLYGDADGHCLDGDALKSEIPDVLLERAEDMALQQEDLDGLMKDNKLDLVKFAKFAQGAIKIYMQKLLQNNPFSELEKMSATVQKELKRHAFIVDRLEKLQQKLVNEKEMLLASTEAHTTEVFASITMDDIKSLPGEILPQTPPMNIHTGVAVNFGSPFQTPELITPPTTVQVVVSEASPNLKPYPGTPISRSYTRSCSPLLYDPLQAEHDTHGVSSDHVHPVITVGVKHKKQWTKVTGVTPGTLNREATKMGPSSPKKLTPKKRIAGTKASAMVRSIRASEAFPETQARTPQVPASLDKLEQKNPNKHQMEDKPEPVILPENAGPATKIALSPSGFGSLPPCAISPVTTDRCAGTDFMLSMMSGRTSSTPVPAVSELDAIQSRWDKCQKAIEASLDDSLLMGSEGGGSLVSTDDEQ